MDEQEKSELNRLIGLDRTLRAKAISLFVSDTRLSNIPIASFKYGRSLVNKLCVYWAGDFVIRNLDTGMEYRNAEILQHLKDTGQSAVKMIYHFDGIEQVAFLNYEIVDIPFFMFPPDLIKPTDELPLSQVEFNPYWLSKIQA